MKICKKIKNLLILSISIFILSLTVGCSGTRKVNKENKIVDKESLLKSNEEMKSDSLSNFKKETSTIVSENGNTIIETITITPINPNKEATVKDTTGVLIKVNNAVYKLERMIKKNVKELKQGIKEQQVAIKRKVSNASFEKHDKEKIEHQVKLSEKKQFNSIYLLLMIILLICVVYLFYKNNPTSKLFNIFKR